TDAALTGRWHDLAHDDPATFTANLRAAGFPESLVRRIVWTQLRQGSRLAVIARVDAPYWRRNIARSEAWNRQNGQNLHDPAREAYAALFGGVPDERANPALIRIDAALSGLDPESYLRVAHIEESFLHAMPPADMPRTPAGFQAWSATREAALQNELRATLSPEEFRDYSLRGSMPMMSLVSRAIGFRPSQAEYDGLAQILNVPPSATAATATLTPTAIRSRMPPDPRNPQIAAFL